MSLLRGEGRGRAFFRFLFAVAWWIAAYLLSERAARGFIHGPSFPLLRNVFEIFLLILGYSYMEMAWDGAREPLRAMGLGGRRGAVGEFALGAAVGWGMVTAVLLVVALYGHFYVRLWSSPHAWGSLVLQLFILATASLAAEIAFRGYAFQKLIQSTGPVTATILAGIFFAFLRLETPGATAAALWVSGVAAVVLSVAYVRTRALWLCWGLHFAWLASIGVLFGQPLAGSRRTSSVIHTYADGPTWLTGSEYGPEGSVVTLIVLWIGLYILFRVTRNLAWKYTDPELKPLGLGIEPRRATPPNSPIRSSAALNGPWDARLVPITTPDRPAVPSGEMPAQQSSTEVSSNTASFPSAEPPETASDR